MFLWDLESHLCMCPLYMLFKIWGKNKIFKKKKENGYHKGHDAVLRCISQKLGNVVYNGVKQKKASDESCKTLLCLSFS